MDAWCGVLSLGERVRVPLKACYHLRRPPTLLFGDWFFSSPLSLWAY